MNPLDKFSIFLNWSIVWNPFHKSASLQYNIHCEFQGLKPKGETNRSFLILHPSSGEDTVNTVGSHHKSEYTLQLKLTYYG